MVIAGGGCKDNVFNISGSRSNGVQCVTYSRPLVTSKLRCFLKYNLYQASKYLHTDDSLCDSTINPSQPQYVVWGVGGLGETAFKHFKRAQGW